MALEHALVGDALNRVFLAAKSVDRLQHLFDRGVAKTFGDRGDLQVIANYCALGLGVVALPLECRRLGLVGDAALVFGKELPLLQTLKASAFSGEQVALDVLGGLVQRGLALRVPFGQGGFGFRRTLA